MINFIKVGLFLSIVSLMYSCTNYIEDKVETPNIDSVFALVRTIDTDSLDNIIIEWRSCNLLLIWKHDSIFDQFSPPLLLKRDINSKVRFKSGERWIELDSIHHYFPFQEIGLSIKRTKYIFNIMDCLNIYEIRTTLNNEALWVTKDNIKFYYIYDFESIIKRKGYNKLQHISDNWWISE